MKACTQLMRDASFDEAPARCKVVVAGRQGPDGMQMVRQQDPAIDPEWPLLANGLDRLSQCQPHLKLRQEPLSPLGDDCEEE